ncbi:L-fucose mutarotase [Maribacter sp. 4U21]|uniref:L-rhamnose mutarotase n=1 Tax=Maribacter sp. 4U21 TaxID=1889779 RepID=UPI000C155E08|nr:L-rhamnose mutarotase [Maribacter sp. 4U21]PIB29513.1 L-fucose mutarotase [Maribacter sp. 4U21]
MGRYCLALDLKEDAHLIEEYIAYHKEVWPEILKSITDSGIVDMEIYCVHNRLFMIIDADSNFSFAKKNELDSNNKKVSEWERLMWKYQKALPNSSPGTKWELMEKIFELKKTD